MGFRRPKLASGPAGVDSSKGALGSNKLCMDATCRRMKTILQGSMEGVGGAKRPREEKPSTIRQAANRPGSTKIH